MNPTNQLHQANEENKNDAIAILGRGFGTLPMSENRRMSLSQHRDENFEGFLKKLRGADELEKPTCSAEDYLKLMMYRGYGLPRAPPADKLYAYNNQEFDDTLLQHIKSSYNALVLSMLQGISNVHQLTDSTGTTLLHFAAKYGNQDLVQHLIDLGATVDVRNRHRETPLIYAAEAGKEATVKLLLKYNADILLPGHNYCALGMVLLDRDDDQPTFNRHVKENIVRALLDRVTAESLNASEHVKTKKFHETCKLYHFISLRNIEITRVLLEKGSPIDVISEVEGTALHVAARQLDLEHVKLLLEFGADVNVRNYNGWTPITSIHNFDNQNRTLAIIQVLVAAGASLIDRSSGMKKMGWPLLTKGNRDIVRAALQCPIDLRRPNITGMGPLHALAENRHADIFEELQGFDFGDVRCDIDATLLHHAAGAGNLSSVEFFLASGIDVDARDKLGRTPLVWAIRGGTCCEDIDYYWRCIEGLLERGASPRFFRAPLAFFERVTCLARPVVAYSALLEVYGREIEESVMREIESNAVHKTTFELGKLQLEEMKGVWISKTVNLFDFLVASDAKISMYARNARLVLSLTDVMEEYSSESYYHRRLRTRFLKLTRLAEMRKSVTVVVNEVLSEMYDLNVQNVAQTIVNFVDDEALHGMVPNSE